jgi:hypothetical protein
MRIFQHANLSGEDTCLVCEKADDKPVVLIGVIGTEDGHNMQARQVHVDCIELYYYPEQKIIAQKL